jgi:hypothetical protein
MDIQIIELRLLPGHKATRGFCDVRIGDITIKDFRIFQTNGKTSVRNPFASYKDVDGNLKFRQLVNLPSNVQTEVNALVLGEYYRRVKEQRNERQQ